MNSLKLLNTDELQKGCMYEIIYLNDHQFRYSFDCFYCIDPGDLNRGITKTILTKVGIEHWYFDESVSVMFKEII